MYPPPPGDAPATYSLEIDSMTLSYGVLLISGKISAPSLSIFNGVKGYVLCGGTLAASGEGKINPDGSFSVGVNVGNKKLDNCQIVAMAISRNFDAVAGQVPPLQI
jgi:hypothetical protein